MWNVSQRRALIVLVAAAGAYIGVRGYFQRVYIGDPLRGVGVRAAELQATMDPNTATAAMLETIPGFGQARAKAVIAYREKFAAEHPGELAFTKIEDLRKVKGIGAAMEERVRGYVRFEGP